MELKAITYNYTEDDGILYNKVVCVCTKDKLLENLNDIKELFSEYKLIKDVYDETCDNYYLEFEDEKLTFFYTSDYEINKLYL